jgi:hypothetical protein
LLQYLKVEINKFRILFIFIIIAFRLYLPYLLIHYVEKQINKIPEYHVKIDDLDVHLYRGSYTIKHIQLWKTTKTIPVPFFEAKIVDLAVQWPTLLHGKFLAKILVESPIINFVTDPSNINSLNVDDGKIFFRNYKGHPPFDSYIKNIVFTLENMQNANGEKKELLSSFLFKGAPMGGGEILVKGNFNPFDKKPTFYLKGKLTSLNISYIANLLKHYTDVDVRGGTFNLYGEVAAAKNVVKGYLKPFLKDVKIGDPNKETPMGVLYNGVASVVAKVLENPEKKTIATKINIQGRIDDPDTSILSIIGYLLRHAFIRALLPQIDHSVHLQSVFIGNENASDKFPRYHN